METKDLTLNGASLTESMTADLAPISIKEARKVLGSEYKDKSDETIARLIMELTIVARSHVRGVLKSSIMMYN